MDQTMPMDTVPGDTAPAGSPSVDPSGIRFRAGVRREGPFAVRYVTVHGYRRAYVKAGSGPVLLLVHGIGDSSDTWRPVFQQLAEHHTVIAPDLLGHGRSEKPRGDYTVAGYANGMRDLLSILEVDRVTVVGHSLGGGVAAQFAYQFPERCERLVLVGSGGVGRTVSPLLRLAAVPGAELLMPLLGLPPVKLASRFGAGLMRLLDTAFGPRRRGDPGRVRRAPRRPGPPSHPPHPAFGRRLAGTGHHHVGPRLSGRGASHAHRVGTPRRDHPARARPPGPAGLPGERARDLRRGGPLPAPQRPPEVRRRRPRLRGRDGSGTFRIRALARAAPAGRPGDQAWAFRRRAGGVRTAAATSVRTSAVSRGSAGCSGTTP